MTERKESCGACRFFNLQYHDEGECRRHPPQKLSRTRMVSKNSYSSEQEVGSETWTEWPEVRKKNWCGDFEEKEVVKT